MDTRVHLCSQVTAARPLLDAGHQTTEQRLALRHFEKHGRRLQAPVPRIGEHSAPAPFALPCNALAALRWRAPQQPPRPD
eukprot:365940-Chlamydomonas_euryale.AAC.28